MNISTWKTTYGMSGDVLYKYVVFYNSPLSPGMCPSFEFRHCKRPCECHSWAYVPKAANYGMPKARTLNWNKASGQSCGGNTLVKGLASCKCVLQYPIEIDCASSSMTSETEAIFTPWTLPQCLSFAEYLLHTILITAPLSCFRKTAGREPNSYVNMSCTWSVSPRSAGGHGYQLRFGCWSRCARLLLAQPKHWKQRFACGNGDEYPARGLGRPRAARKISISKDKDLRFNTMCHCSNGDMLDGRTKVWHYAQQFPKAPLLKKINSYWTNQ